MLFTTIMESKNFFSLQKLISIKILAKVMLYWVTNLIWKTFSSFTSNNEFFSWLPCNVKILTIFTGIRFFRLKFFFVSIIEAKSPYNAFFLKGNTTLCDRGFTPVLEDKNEKPRFFQKRFNFEDL